MNSLVTTLTMRVDSACQLCRDALPVKEQVYCCNGEIFCSVRCLIREYPDAVLQLPGGSLALSTVADPPRGLALWEVLAAVSPPERSSWISPE